MNTEYFLTILTYINIFRNIIIIETKVGFSFLRVESHSENHHWHWIFNMLYLYYSTFVAVSFTVILQQQCSTSACSGAWESADLKGFQVFLAWIVDYIEPLFYTDVQASDHFIMSANVTKPWHLYTEIYLFLQQCTYYWMSTSYQALF